MLDLHINKTNSSCGSSSFAVSVHVKSTAQGCTLSDRSMHLPSIHYTWPLARFRHFEQITTGVKIARAAQECFYRKLVSDCPQHMCIASLRDRLQGRSRSFSKKAANPVGSWLVIPYHPAWHQARLGTEIRSICEDFGDVGLREFVPNISWSLGGIHLWRQFSKQKQIGIVDTRDGG